MAQFVLVNVVVAVLMKHLEESHKQMEEDEDFEIDLEIAKEIEAEKRALEDAIARKKREQELNIRRPLMKINSLPSNFTFTYLNEQMANNSNERSCDTFSVSTNNLFKSPKDDNKSSIKRPNSSLKIDIKKCTNIEDFDMSVKKSNTSPVITIENREFESSPLNEKCTSELLVPHCANNRKFSDFMDDDSSAPHCLLPSYPELSIDADQQSLDSVTWSADAESLSSLTSNKQS